MVVIVNTQTRMAFAETADIETSSDNYAQRFSGKVGAWFLQVQEEATLKMLAPYPGSTILDVGGGHGQLTGALVDNNFDLTVLGSDEACRARISHYLETYRCTFEVGDILNLPYPDQAFGVVVSFRLLPHVTLWEQYIRELTRVAEKAVIIDYPDVRSFNYLAPKLFSWKKRMEGNTRPYTTFRQRQVLDAFRSSGFIRADRFAEFFLPMVLHRKAKLPRLSQMMEDFCRGVGLTYSFGSPIILKMVREQQSS
jgi:ubiquinone/menaquinone biosynthesis C-methylase UbiE